MEKLSKKGHKRYQSILNAALEIFVEKGYEGTSLNDIINKSGGSLASVYKFFTNKEGLFKAIIEREIDEFCEDIDRQIDLKASHSPDEFLYKFGILFFNIICDRKTTAISRMVLAEGFKNDCAISRIYLQQVLSKVHKILIDFFQRQEIQGKLSNFLDAKLAASIFCSLVRNPYYHDAILLNTPIELSQAERENHVKICVNLFLNGVCKRV